jgi:hypothetical protein
VHRALPLHPDTMTRRTVEIAAFCAALLLAALIFHAWLAAHDDQLRLSATLATQKQALDAADARERDRTATLKDALAQIDALKCAAQTQTPVQLARALRDALHLPQPITIVPAPNTSSPSAGAAPSNSSVAANPSVGARHAVPEQANSTVTPLSNDEPAPEVRTAGVPPAPLPSSTMQQGSAKNSQQGTAQRARSLLDSLFHRASPRTPADEPSSAAAPTSGEISPVAAAPPTSSAPPQSSPSLSSAGTPTAEIPAADLAPLYDYVQDCRACQLQLTAAKQNATDDAAKIRALTRERDAAVTAAKGGSFWLRLKRNAHWLAIGAAIGVVTSTAALCNTGHCRK